MATTPAEYLIEIAAVTDRDRWLITNRRSEGDVMTETGDKIAALTDAARALGGAGVRFALIGGVAVGIHSGVPRATADVAVAILSSAERGAVRTALERAGFRCVGEFAHSMNLRDVSGEPVQLAIDPGFDLMIERAEPFALGAGSVPLVARTALITMKERAAADPQRRKSKRLRDQADIELLRGDVPDPDEGW